ncbi:MAG TPA: hypothetical protein VJS30_10470 [Paraburkholderia sp.]|nr:hypothetical protein [Paraburkholderia sp.]
MGVSETGAASSNNTYDQYAPTNQPNPQDSGTTNNDSGGSTGPSTFDTNTGNNQSGGNNTTPPSAPQPSGTQDGNNTTPPPAAQPSGTQDGNSTTPPPAAQPLPSVNPVPQQGVDKTSQSQPTGPVLNGATRDELKGLLNKYDTTSSGQTHDSRNRANDAATSNTIQKATDLDYTGYPPQVRAFENRMAESNAQLAALPREMRDYYAGQLAAIDSVYRDTPDANARGELDKKTGDLQSEILAEYNHSINDPLDETMAVFNHPVGAGYLEKTSQLQLKQLDTFRADFLNAGDAAARETVFKQATELKTNLQQAASNGASKSLNDDKAAWNDAFKYVDKLAADAQAMQDPSRSFKSIGDGLFSFNTGMGEDKVADRRVLAFTQRMMDDPSLRDRLDSYQVNAAKSLNEQGLGGAIPYSEIIKNLPAPGPDYVRDLGDMYTGAIKGQTEGERQASFNRIKPYLQAAEGTARFLLGLTPFAPLSTVLDGASTLSPSQRLGIDIGSGIAGAIVNPLAGGITAGGKTFTSFLRDFRAEAATAEDSAQDLKLGLNNGQLALTPEEKDAQAAAAVGEPRLSSSAHLLTPELQAPAEGGEPAQLAYKPADIGPSLDPRMLEARARIEGNPMAIPSRYATELDPQRQPLSPDQNAQGVLNDANNNHYIRNGDQYFKVKYDSDNETWRAVNPERSSAFSYPVRYDPQSGAWTVHGDVGGPGGGPLSRLVSLGKYAKNDPRIARLIESKVLKPQDPQTCFLDHGRVAQHAAGVPDGRLKPVSTGPLNADQLRKELDKGPLVLSARNIARPDSNYTGMHTVVLLKTVKDNGRDYVLGIDLDDTIGRNGQAQSLANGDFGGVEYDLDQLSKQAAPYVDEDTGAQLEMYHRPQENKGIWGWFS